MTNEEKAQEICSDYNYTQFLNEHATGERAEAFMALYHELFENV